MEKSEDYARNTASKATEVSLPSVNQAREGDMRGALETIAGYTIERSGELTSSGKYYEAVQLWKSLERQIPIGAEYDHMRLAAKEQIDKIGNYEEKRWENRKMELMGYPSSMIATPIFALAAIMSSIGYPFIKLFYQLVDPKGRRYAKFREEVKDDWKMVRDCLTGQAFNTKSEEQHKLENRVETLI